MEQSESGPAAAPKSAPSPTKVTKLRPNRAAKGGKHVRPARPGPDNRPKKTLPTDRIHFQKQIGALRAFGAVNASTGKPVSNEDVAKLMGIQASTVSLTNAFFVDSGFLRRVPGNGFLPAAEVVSFARTHEWNESAAPEKLAPVVARTWFAERLLPGLGYSPMEEDRAVAELAEGAAAAPIYRAQVRILLDYLEKTGLVIREGKTLRAGTSSTASMPVDASERSASPAPAAEFKETREVARPAVATGFSKSPTEGVVQFHVTVRVDMAEFAGWPADRIASFFAGIAQVLAAKGALENPGD